MWAMCYLEHLILSEVYMPGLACHGTEPLLGNLSGWRRERCEGKSDLGFNEALMNGCL